MAEFICEFTTNHMGNLNILLEMVRLASATGAKYIKMQKKNIETFYSQAKLNAPYTSPYGKSYRDYRKIFEFGKRDFDLFNEECNKYNMEWFATAQDISSLKFLMEYDLPMYKLASLNAKNKDILKYCKSAIPNDKTIVVSVAGLELKEIEELINYFPKHNLIINHCVAEYPCKYENLRLGNIKVLKDKFGSDRVSIGYSGHEEGIQPSLVAIKLGADYVERHFCMSRHSFVHHIECSLDFSEFKEMVDLTNAGLDKSILDQFDSSIFKSSFGMSDMEKSFLLDLTYGKDYLKEDSKIKKA